MSTKIRKKVKDFIEDINNFNKNAINDDQSIKEEYENTLLDDYSVLFKKLIDSVQAEYFESKTDEITSDIIKIYVVYYMLDEVLYIELNKGGAIDKGWKHEAQIRMYITYLKTFREIVHLLFGGFSDCASARIRSLYELGVFISIINKNDDDLAERYCKYYNVQRLKMAKSLKDNDKVRLIKNQIKDFGYESDYAKEYGWANPLFKNKKPIYFSDLVKLTEYEEIEYMYKMNCNYVHAGLFSSLNSLDLDKTERWENIWNTGPSKSGIKDVLPYVKEYVGKMIIDYIKYFDEDSTFMYLIVFYLVNPSK